MLATLWSILSSAAGPANAAESGLQSRAPHATAADLYHDYCSVCHGDKGDGRSRARGSMQPPPLAFTEADPQTLNRERMLVSVRHGRPGTAMAGWGSQLRDDQIQAVVDFIRERFMRQAGSNSQGARIYARNCSVCHGDHGQGAVWATTSLSTRPRNFTTPAAARELDRERMIQSATYGRADTAMPGFASQLSNAEIESVVDFIRGRFMVEADAAPAQSAAAHAHGSGTPAGHPHGAHEHATRARAGVTDGDGFPSGLRGDASRGAALYRINCVPCHGERGNGQGPRAYFILPKPRDFTHPAARQSLDRAHLYAAIAKGTLRTEMPAWEKVLDAQSIADLAEYVHRSFIAPTRAEAARRGTTDR
ncbi:MAG: c-type cytochrome [Gammaproteobacteria bacterium]|nr:c-type cytochrome [Gammaproteobacteria bacterium]